MNFNILYSTINTTPIAFIQLLFIVINIYEGIIPYTLFKRVQWTLEVEITYCNEVVRLNLVEKGVSKEILDKRGWRYL